MPENPESDPVTYDNISMIRTSLEQLRAYFCTDSQEIPTHFIDNKALMVNSILQLYDQSTRQLIELKDRNCDQHLRPENILKIIQIRACNKDLDAINFLQQTTESSGEGKRDVSEIFNNNISSGTIFYSNNFSSNALYHKYTNCLIFHGAISAISFTSL